MSEAVLVRREGRVLVLVNNNPAARNAISPGFYEGLAAGLAQADADPETGAVVLTGAGNFFCAGGDLQQLAKRRELPPAGRRERIEALHDAIRAIGACSKPVIAAVEGGAAGAGVSFALACDMLVMARDAYFSVAYVKVGLSPDGGATAFLSKLVSRQLLTELALTGDRIGAGRLDALGVVNRLTDSGRAEAEAIALAARIAEGPRRALGRIKTLCLQAPDNALEAQLDLEAHHMVESLGDAESSEGIAAFFDKRAPRFRALRAASGEPS
ncbi:enoyl-CoA hydratase [Piscinibacter sp. XHJ-5]|uniref:oxepin-CoA hydrolase, alternative type n=1 Tax=Piscinibacter sp. XHJ-5 TaxID=3037797 RepID=UPI0024530844|nr:enoyl-CoA hydratase [Piscinibacter sp. XHJ-5]